MNQLEQLKQSEMAKRVNTAEWRMNQFHPIDLPSGLRIIGRNVDMTDIMLTGHLPPSILEAAEEAAEKGEDKIELKEIGLKVLGEDPGGFLDLLNAITKAVFVLPAVVDTWEETDDDHILISEISMSDKYEIMNFIGMGAEQMRPFPRKQGEPAETAQPGDGLLQETIGDRPDGDPVG